MRRRSLSPDALLSRIRAHDFAAFSDGGLRLAVQRLQSRAPVAATDDLLPECFAVAAEAADRRLGIWRLFDGPPPNGGDYDAQTICETAAVVSRQRGSRRPGDILLPAAFYQAARRADSEGRLKFQATNEQMLAAIHLCRGRVAQMDAGEGKTIAIAFAAALHAVMGRRVHVVTANDYLAERDAALLEPVYRSLGISSGAVPSPMEERERRHVYRRSIVYGAMRELGFDFLRDNLKIDAREQVQQPLDVAIVDEADHALIDEAFTPLIISGSPAGGIRMAVRINDAVSEMIATQREFAGELARRADLPGSSPRERLSLLATLLLADPENPALTRSFAAAPRLRRQARDLAEDDYEPLTSELCYIVHPGAAFVTLTGNGRSFMERRLHGFNGGADERDVQAGRPESISGRRETSAAVRRLARHYALENQVSQALTAHLLLKRGVDYLVDRRVDRRVDYLVDCRVDRRVDCRADSLSADGPADEDGIVLIDPHTGRAKPDSIYQHGLQQAVEAREGVKVQPERETLAQVSVSGFVGHYRQLAGISGTAEPAAGEFRRKYGLEVAAVPPVHPSRRADLPPKVYLNRQDKLAAVADEIAARHRAGQPILAGTRTVEQSEELAALLEERGTPHRVLNAVTSDSEARIVRGAGAFGAVTVATHMAGRGVDILLAPDLDASISSRCAAEIRRLLTAADEDAAVVDVICPSPEQAEVLLAELARAGVFHIAPESGGSVLRVSCREGEAGRQGRGRLRFALGLCVIGTEIHSSARITLQLNGRSGRQGQFGQAQTCLSLEDPLVNLEAPAFLKLVSCRRADDAGRVYYAGPEVSRRIERLQAAADREGEARRGLIQDYTAELDRQTGLHFHRRREVMGWASQPDRVNALCRDVSCRVASRLAAARLGPETDGDYAARFAALAREARLDFGIDCSPLYGLDLALVPGELAGLLIERLERQAAALGRTESGMKSGAAVFPKAARLTYLQVCGDLWPSHLATLRDSITSQMLTHQSHKSAVAGYIRRSAGAWRGFQEQVEGEFLSRLAAFPSAAWDASPATVSSETERLLAQMDNRPGAARGGD